MYFTQEHIDQLIEGFVEAREHLNACKERFIVHEFATREAREHAHHGLCRRLETLDHAVDRVYELLPPDIDDIPPRGDVKEATIHIQASISNIIGCLDNLAWIWINERNLKHRDGSTFRTREVKLSRDCRDLWRDLPQRFRDKIVEFRDWFTHITEWRDALVHRIPLYIPPYCVRDTEQYNQLVKQANEALRNGDLELHVRLKQQYEEMHYFVPCIMHSFEEEAEPAVFHANLVADIKTIAVLANLFLTCLEEA
ncbi:hypothetical protein ABIE64_003449 [Thalassospira sp. MBR-102]|jgi:hypothetical protein|uniref:Cthe-2314-like HEPN domain-containing protein n=1 Tax=Thalassospira xiamenensis M-5 = DSM 17429 TaxID=1123366 RepID=A0AB72UE32_9PROT|nr:hypothetical protein [Thalassospira xiamenensis]AJD52414.1 hypothetical protein TH3_11490 [Thalassospira xiamenensis M-5 = DSM 17429]SIT30902.1 hypothetical protein SAMN02744133_11875 [Thalassospira xiamenensis M-5 = DSM 17429]